MKKILHVIDHLGLGGAQAVLFDLVTLADPSQWHVEVATLHGWGIFAEALEKAGIKVHSLAPSVWPPVYIPAFQKISRSFDLFHFHLSGANWITKPLAAFTGSQPRLVHDHASGNLQFRGLGSTMIDAIMHRFSSHTIAVAPEVKNFLMNYETLSAEDVTVIPNGVNTKLFRPCDSLEKKEARSFFGLDEDAMLIGTVGRLAVEKNQKLFLKAAQKALQQGLQATFVLAGSGPEEALLRGLAKELGIAERVQFLGQVEERALFYRTLDLFALTSLHEGLPIVLLEAMASGIPVISTDLEGARYVLEDERHGTIVPSNNVEAMTEAFLTQIFHGSHSEAKEKADETRRRQSFDQSCMSPYCSDQNSTTTQCSSALAKLQTERHEISGLKDPLQHQTVTARARVESDFSALHAAKKVAELYEQLLLDSLNLCAKAI